MTYDELKKYFDEAKKFNEEEIDSEIIRIDNEILQKNDLMKKMAQENSTYTLGQMRIYLQEEKEERERQKGKVFIDHSRYMITLDIAHERDNNGFNFESFTNWIKSLQGIQKVNIMDFEGENIYEDEFNERYEDEDGE